MGGFQNFIDTISVQAYAFLKIPLVAFVRPRIIENNSARFVISIPFLRRNRNHLNSMYFGALCIGAEMAPGAYVMQTLRKRKLKVGMIFSHFEAEFLKKAEGETHFICEHVQQLDALIDQVVTSREKAQLTVPVQAIVPSQSMSTVVAKFKVTISLKAFQH